MARPEQSWRAVAGLSVDHTPGTRDRIRETLVATIPSDSDLGRDRLLDEVLADIATDVTKAWG
ncbi:MAG: hypothetical protein JJ992_24090 [Planctomycetes bacterium]|nr:hypothetical protein [Planctomycetota bacterium]